MPSYFPCPNTQCTYQFDADILPPAAMVTCPLCRTRFPYRANRPLPAPGTAPASEAPAPGGRVVTIRELPKGGSILTTVLWVAGFCVVLAGLVVMLSLRGRPKIESVSEATDRTFNVKVEPFPVPWESDAHAQKTVDANVLGRKRSGPDAWVAIAARDFSDRQPRKGELEEMLQNRLRGAFSTLEVVPLDGETWAGNATLAVRFTGNLDEQQVRGEAFAMAYKGIGYVYFTWGPEGSWESIRAEATGLREKIKPADYRDKWVEKRANVQVHAVAGAGYQIEDSDGVWVRAKPEEEWDRKERVKFAVDPKDIDPNAVMALRAEYRIRERGDSNRKPAEATALVIELSKGGDPLDVAKAQAIAWQKRQYGDKPPDLQLEEMLKSPTNTPLPTGGPPIGRFRLRDPFDARNPSMWIISALFVGGKTVGVLIHCLEKDASYVEEWMIHLAGSLKAR